MHPNPIRIRRHPNLQRRPQYLVRLPQLETRGVLHRMNREGARVERQYIPGSFALEVERHRAFQHLSVEAHIEREIQVAHRHQVRA